MNTQLILGKRELNPDVYFTDKSKWTIGADWTVFLNDQPGAICINGSGGLLELTPSPLRVRKKYKYTLYVESCVGGAASQLIIGGNTVVINASLTPQIYQGTVTTNVVNDVFLYCDSGDDLHINYLRITEDPDTVSIDLNDDVDIPISYSIADIKDPSSRNAAYSKTVTIKGSKENNLYFNHIFEIGIDGTFNPNKKVSATLLSDGIEVLNGICQLKEIHRIENGNNNYDNITYDIALFGKLIDLFYAVGDMLLSDLDFSEYDHYYTRTNQRNSWYNSIVKNGATYVNSVNGSGLTASSCANNSGRLQVNFTSNHGLTAGDWLLVPDGSISAGSTFYYGEHEVYSVVSSTSVILRCPFDQTAGTTFNTINGPNGRVRKHIKSGEGYVYPMLNYGGGLTTNYHVNNFYPAIYVKEYVDKIFKKAGFVYESTFFNSTMFKKLIIPANTNVLQLTQDQIDAKLFRASATNSSIVTYTIKPDYLPPSAGYGLYWYRGHAISGYNSVYGTPSNGTYSLTPPPTIDIAIDNDSTVPNFDTANNFNTSTYRWTCPNTGYYGMNFTGTFIHTYLLPAGVHQTNNPNTGPMSPFWNINNLVGSNAGCPSAQVQIYDYTTNTIISSQNYNLTSGINVTININNVLLTAGRQYGVRVKPLTTLKGQFYNSPTTNTNNQGGEYSGDITVRFGCNANAVFKNSYTATTVQEGDYLNLNIAVPQKKQAKELLRDLIKTFNLYVQPDRFNEKKVYIEPRNIFYSQGQIQDWTRKLDTSQKMVITPMGELNAKNYEFKFAKDNTTFGKDHFEKYGNTYGDFSYTVDNDFINGTNTTEVSYTSTILAEDTPGSGRVISIVNTDDLRMLIFNCTGTQNTNATSTWWHTTTVPNNNVGSLLFPYAGHCDKVEAPGFDINWSYPRGVYFSYDAWTDNNNFNREYKQMIEEITNKDSKIIRCQMYLTAQDIFKLDFRDLFLVDGHYLRLNKINDYFVNKFVPVECEFIKAETKPPFVPRPFITVSQVEPIYNPMGRMINGEQSPELALESFGANSNRVSNTVNVIGDGNSVNEYGSRNLSVIGDNNTIGSQTTNITITGNNNTVSSGLSNVSIINTDNVNVTESNTVYISGIKINSSGSIVNTSINVVDAGEDLILCPFNDVTIINVIDAGEDCILNFGSHTTNNVIDAGEDEILNR